MSRRKAGQRCARTKQRFAADDRIVVCPGLGCHLLYAESAYALNLKCTGCGHDPTQGDWEPSERDEPTQGRLASLLARAAVLTAMDGDSGDDWEVNS